MRIFFLPFSVFVLIERKAHFLNIARDIGVAQFVDACGVTLFCHGERAALRTRVGRSGAADGIGFTVVVC